MRFLGFFNSVCFVDFSLLGIVIEYIPNVRVPKPPLPSLHISVGEDRFCYLPGYAKCFVLI